jgi:hypothetical protein
MLFFLFAYSGFANKSIVILIIPLPLPSIHFLLIFLSVTLDSSNLTIMSLGVVFFFKFLVGEVCGVPWNCGFIVFFKRGKILTIIP